MGARANREAWDVEGGAARDLLSGAPQSGRTHLQWLQLQWQAAVPQQDETRAVCLPSGAARKPHNCWAGEPSVATMSAMVESRLVSRIVRPFV